MTMKAAAVLGVILTLATGCSGSSGATVHASQPPATTSTTVPADVVDGVPLRSLAVLARTEASTYGDDHPSNLRAALGSDYDINNLRSTEGQRYDYGDKSSKKYVVAVNGYFSCLPQRGCEGSRPGTLYSSTSTPRVQAVPLSTLLVTIDPTTLQVFRGFRIVAHEVDMGKLGKVYNLDGYK